MWEIIFGWPKDPSEQISKVSFFDFIGALFYLTLLSSSSHLAKQLIYAISFFPSSVGIDISIPLLFSYLASLLFNHCEIHRRIEKTIGIRMSFEKEEILKPLLKDARISRYQWKEIDADQDHFVRSLFYRYVDAAGVSKLHLKWRSYNLWAWRYIAMTNAAMAGLTAFFIVGSSPRIAIFLVAWVVLMPRYCRFLESKCIEVTKKQVKEIRSSDNFAADREKFLKTYFGKPRLSSKRAA